MSAPPPVWTKSRIPRGRRNLIYPNKNILQFLYGALNNSFKWTLILEKLENTVYTVPWTAATYKISYSRLKEYWYGTFYKYF
jgi:uncharacterized membrane protein YccF (DUF307 family)